jgi:ethanolamine-phosphate cytidylyltransferase
MCVFNLSVTRYVDEVIIGAPWAVTEDMIKTMNISIVCHGTHWDEPHNNSDGFKLDPYAVPKRMGIYKEIPSSSNLSVMEIIDRIVKVSCGRMPIISAQPNDNS